MATCKHPRVQIVAREEDSEFVECVECGEIFESSEFKDMTIEDTNLSNESWASVHPVPSPTASWIVPSPRRALSHGTVSDRGNRG